ncbi:hypothetical protein CGC21_14135 [Leishmania donovani]|uniref:PH-like domain-containing protein n=1 Tax=Leishmania donovani TaxID=5661 RepID=A0A504XTN2_LEIDO|nr:hypothetical protein CGC21_14135 [Leishmania donovani]
MQLQSRAPEHFSAPFFASPSSSVACESGCSLDALERLVHFTGAGADACLYAVHPAQAEGADSAVLTPTAEGLRYWLNPSVRARPTTATCEITNLGPPFFASTSTSMLRISATPLFVDGRCFPTRCVVSLATSAQRLDGVSLRPVVVTEWNLTASGAAGVCTTTVPLRTLYHLAVLISSFVPATGVEEVRLYLHLRFMGCSDGSDTHRIAAVRLRYEQLGTAAEVLPQLLQRRQRAAARVMLPPSPYDVKDHSEGRVTRAGAPLEEVEVGVTAGSSTATSSGGKDMGDDVGKGRLAGAKERRTPTSPPPSTRMRSDGGEDAAGEAQQQLLRSPPQRSATRPRAERSLSADRSSSSWIEAAGPTEGRDGPKLVCVDRVLRIPPPPPKSAAAAGSAPSLLSGPWPPRKVRTIVLAPSISPSLCSSSAGTSPRGSPLPLPSPPPTTNADSSAKAHSNTSLAGTACCREAESCDREGFDDAVDALMPLTQQNVQGRFLECTKSDERTSYPVSAAGTSSQRCRCHESSSVPRHIPSAEAREVPQTVAENRPDPHPHPFAPQQLYAHSDPAVLWAATSLLGTLPWTLASQHQSRTSTPAASVASSRAPSCDGSAQAMPTDSAKGAPCWQMRQPAPSKSFLDPGSYRNTNSHRPERTTVAAKADSAAMTQTYSTDHNVRTAAAGEEAAAPGGASSSLDARPRRSATADVHERRRLSTAAFPMSSSAVLSVMPSSWLRGNATVAPEAPTESAAEVKSQSSTASQRSFRSSTAPPSSRRPQYVSSPAGAADMECMEDTVSSGGGHGSNNPSTFRQCVVQTFAVWKHHASRRGVGRRWLRIERLPPSPSTSAAVRFRITLDKVCIRRTDKVEVWCGLRAYHSGVIHHSKVHRAECCLVIRCNAQLVMAVELESTEAASVESARERAREVSLPAKV